MNDTDFLVQYRKKYSLNAVRTLLLVVLLYNTLFRFKRLFSVVTVIIQFLLQYPARLIVLWVTSPGSHISYAYKLHSVLAVNINTVINKSGNSVEIHPQKYCKQDLPQKWQKWITERIYEKGNKTRQYLSKDNHTCQQHTNIHPKLFSQD